MTAMWLRSFVNAQPHINAVQLNTEDGGSTIFSLFSLLIRNSRIWNEFNSWELRMFVFTLIRIHWESLTVYVATDSSLFSWYLNLNNFFFFFKFCDLTLMMIKTEERLVDSSSSHHGYPVRHILPQQQYDNHHHQDEKPILSYLESEACDMGNGNGKHNRYVIQYPPLQHDPHLIKVQPSSHQEHRATLIKMQPPSPPGTKHSVAIFPPVITTSMCLTSANPSTIKYCGSAGNGVIDSRHSSNISPPTSTSNINGVSMNASMDMPNYAQNTSSESVNKSTTQIDQPLSAPDTTKKSSGGRRAEKPPLSYINMIASAIKESPNRRCTLSEIYHFLQKR